MRNAGYKGVEIEFIEIDELSMSIRQIAKNSLNKAPYTPKRLKNE